MRSEILLVNTSSTTVAAGGIVPVGSVVRRYGNALSAGTSGVTANACGYYDVFAGLTITPTAAGQVTASVLVNGAPYAGATATITAAGAGESHSVTIPTCIRVLCNDSVTIQVQLNGASTVTSYTLLVDKD